MVGRCHISLRVVQRLGIFGHQSMLVGSSLEGVMDLLFLLEVVLIRVIKEDLVDGSFYIYIYIVMCLI